MGALISGERELGVGAIEPLSLQFDDYTSVGVVSVEAYLNGSGTDQASVLMPSGSHSVSNNILTTKPLTVTSTMAGKYYMLKITVTVNGTTQQDVRYFKVNIPNEKSGLLRSK